MYVNDLLENIGTPWCRLSCGPCGCTLNSHERSGSVCIVKPKKICSRVRRILQGVLILANTHDPCLPGCTLC